MTHPDAPKVGYLPPAATQWLERHRDCTPAGQPAPIADQPWGLSALRPAADGKPATVLLYVFDWHASGKLVVYGVTGGVRKAYLCNDPNHSALPLARLNKSLVISIPKQAPDPLCSVVVLETAEKLETVDMVIHPGDDATILLHARDGTVHGRTLRYEPEPHKNTLGYWTDPADWVSWQFEVATPGSYRVEILQGCGKGSGGSKVEIAAADQVLEVTVQDTGGFQNFVARDIGRMHFDKPGNYVMSVRPKEKPGVAVMDLRQVTLTPAGEARN
jgi:hypothetical protein